MFTMIYDSPMGPLYIAEQDGAITHLKFSPLEGAQEMTPLLQKCAQQLDAYFAGALTQFDLPLAPQGTPFQKRVWQALCTKYFSIF